MVSNDSIRNNTSSSSSSRIDVRSYVCTAIVFNLTYSVNYSKIDNLQHNFVMFGYIKSTILHVSVKKTLNIIQ